MPSARSKGSAFCPAATYVQATPCWVSPRQAPIQTVILSFAAIVELEGARYESPAPFEPARSLGDVLLAPTIIYVKPVLKALAVSNGIKALAHITGGGFIENIPRVLPPELAAEINLTKLPCPALFGWLARGGRITEREMLRTFNCGIGMVVITAADHEGPLSALLADAGLGVSNLGRIVQRVEQAEQVVFRGNLPL